MTTLHCHNIFCANWNCYECVYKNIVLDARGCCPDYKPLPLDKKALDCIRSHSRAGSVPRFD